MTDLFQQSSLRLDAAIDTVAAAIASNTLSKKQLFATMTSLYGGGAAEGLWSQRDGFDLLEAGLARHLQRSHMALDVLKITGIGELAEALPTHTVRSEEQLRYQQFSTPADLAALAVWLSAPREDDIVLEPSAGHGSLVAMLPNVQALHLNEIDPRRREKLALIFRDATITGFDGAMLSSMLDPAVRPTLILMNPPFSRSLGRGADEYAAVRHLRAAIGRVAGGGRVVAIMPDWFTTSAKLGKIYDETFASCTVQSSIRLAKCYHKQGTSVAVRLYVIDKVPGHIRPTVLDRDTVTAIAETVQPVPRSETVQAPPVRSPAAKAKPASLFKAMRMKPKEARTPSRIVEQPRVGPLAFEALTTPRPLGEQSGVYLPYRPSRVEIAEASEHPTPLVESVAMGSIPAPVPHYVPALQERVLTERLLSEAQIETVIYAGNAWDQYLAGLFIPNEEGVGLTLDESGKEYRKGYFLGDGTGAGKGRQIAACILDNWLAGRRKAIWVSKNESLLEDARRDWSAIGGMPPQYMKPYVKRGKNDAADAEAICEAVTRPTMRFIGAKSPDQQATMMLHRVRTILTRQRTQISNALRAHMAEFGITAAIGRRGLDRLIAVIADQEDARLPDKARACLGVLSTQLEMIKEQILDNDRRILADARKTEAGRRLMKIPGIGPLLASAIVACVPDPSTFGGGRSLSAWIGLTPRQNSSGGKERLGSITKAGNTYLRELLVVGAMAVVRRAKQGSTKRPWVTQLLTRKKPKVAAVALANKNARIIWAMMASGEAYREPKLAAA